MKNTRALIENGLHELQKEPPGKTRDYAINLLLDLINTMKLESQ